MTSLTVPSPVDDRGGDRLPLAGSGLDLPRMRRHRQHRLLAEMDRLGVHALLLFGSGAVSYATGARSPAADAGRSAHLRTAALVLPDDSSPHLFTWYPEGAPPELDPDHVHPALYTESEGGVETLAGRLRELAGGSGPDRLAVDELSAPMHAMLPSLLPKTTVVEAGRVLGPARIHKSPDELECIRRAQHINELAMYDVRAALRPGVRQCELTGIFLQRIAELGAMGSGLDPIWQIMVPRKADGPYTTNGDVAFPLTTTDRVLGEGDVVWVDTGIHYEGYASDFGRTWIVSKRPRPSARQREQFKRWRAVVAATLDQVRQGATGADLTRAARAADGGRTPWLAHFYLVHGVGTESAEAPMIGTDLGPDHDGALTLEAGMVLVLEPVIWDDGYAGYRAEDIVAVTGSGYVALSGHPYDPYEDSAADSAADDRAADRAADDAVRRGCPDVSAGVAAGTGTGVLEEGGRIDAVRLRDDRRRRCFGAMADHGLDSLVLGRDSNARFAAGARRLWTEGTRPFGPGCVVVQETGAVHLLSSWDDGIPPEVGHDHLFGITWNGATLFATLAGIPGLASSRRIGVDGMTPGMAQLIATLAPGAEIVDATGRARHRSPDQSA